MKLDYILLGLLARKSWTGYEFGKWLASDGQFVRSNTDQSQIYRTLARLADRGYVKFRIEKNTSGPAAKVYTLTEDGAKALLEWLDSPYKPPSRFQDADFGARFVSVGILRPESLLPLIETEIAYREDQIRKFRNRDRELAVEPALIDFDRDVAQSLLDDLHNYGTAAADLWLEWLRAERRRLVELFGK